MVLLYPRSFEDWSTDGRRFEKELLFVSTRQGGSSI